MNLDNIVIVLDRPEEARNIGAVCRAMANNNIHTLRIVGDKNSIDVEKVYVLAIHAKYIFDNAQFFSSITEATKDCVISAATTRRKGKKRTGKLYLPEEFAAQVDKIDDGKIAVVFGNERTGLEDDEIAECTQNVTIPSSEEFGSLNLSHAVQIMCYQLFRTNYKNKTGYTPITLSHLDKTVDTIADNLEKIGFFKITGKDDMKHFWRSLLSRAALSEGDAKYIEKIFTKASGLSSKNSGPEKL